MTEKLSRIVAKYPWPFIIGFIVFALALGSRIPSAEIDPEVKNQLPADFPARVDLDKIEEIFGGTEMLMLTVVADDVLAPATLRRVKELSDRLTRLDHVDRVLSLFELKDIKNDGNTMVVDPAVKKIPKTKQEREALRADLKDNDLIYGSVVSQDFKATALVAQLSINAKDEQITHDVKQLIAEVPGPEPVHVAGFPLVRMLMAHNIRSDLRTFLPLGLLIMLIFLFISFRQLRGVLLPFIVVVMSVQVSMGLIPIFGWKIQMITIILPVILLAIANDYGIHIIARYQEVNAPGNTLTKQELAQSTLSHLAKPVLITGLTTMAGLMCLLLHIIVPAMWLGALATIGIGYAVLASLLFIPAMLAVVRKAKPVVTAASGAGGDKMSLMDRGLASLARRVSTGPKKILVSFLAIVVLVAIGIARVEIDTNAVNYFPKDSPIAVASEVADKHFGGSTTFSVAIAGDIKDPKVLRRLDHLEQKLKASPLVDQTASMARVIRRMNKVMNDDDERFDAIPEDRNAVAQLLLMYENGSTLEDFDRLVAFDFTQALLTARINSQSTKDQTSVIRFVRDYVQAANEGRIKVSTETKRPPAVAATSSDAGPEEMGSPFTLIEDAGAGADDASAAKAEEGEGDSPFTMIENEQEDAGASKKTAAAKVKRPPKGPGGSKSEFTMIGGFAVLFNDLVDAIIKGQLSSLGLSLVLVVLIVAVLFRSVVAGLLSGGTLGLAMAFLFGLMGLLRIELNLPTAMLSSIMIGVGVDYTIHFLWRYREERRVGLGETDAVIRTLTTSGRGIIINALSVVVGFSVMFFSSFVPVRYFGFLVVVSISACLLGAMVLMPALVLLLKPKFLQPRGGVK